MTGFPLLSLPLLPQLEILNKMDNKEFCFLSVLSERSKTLVKSAKRSIENVVLQFRGKEDINIIIENKTFWPRIDPAFSCFYRENENFGICEMLEAFKIGEVTIYLRNVENITSNVFWTYTKNPTNLHVFHHHRKLTPEELTFLFEEVTVSNVCSIFAETQSFEHQLGFTHSKLVFQGIHCTTLDAFIASQCRVIHMKCPHPLPPASALNRFLKAWISGGSLRNLEALVIDKDQDVPARFMEEMMNGIAVDWTEDDFYVFQSVDGKRAFAGFMETKTFVFSTQF